QTNGVTLAPASRLSRPQSAPAHAPPEASHRVALVPRVSAEARRIARRSPLAEAPYRLGHLLALRTPNPRVLACCPLRPFAVPRSLQEPKSCRDISRASRVLPVVNPRCLQCMTWRRV